MRNLKSKINSSPMNKNPANKRNFQLKQTNHKSHSNLYSHKLKSNTLSSRHQFTRNVWWKSTKLSKLWKLPENYQLNLNCFSSLEIQISTLKRFWKTQPKNLSFSGLFSTQCFWWLSSCIQEKISTRFCPILMLIWKDLTIWLSWNCQQS